jgi:hypothetical protein
MNVNQLINMIIRRFSGRAMTLGIDKMAGKGKPASEMTEAERKQARQGREMAKNARKSMKLSRRVGRF